MIRSWSRSPYALSRARRGIVMRRRPSIRCLILKATPVVLLPVVKATVPFEPLIDALAGSAPVVRLVAGWRSQNVHRAATTNRCRSLSVLGVQAPSCVYHRMARRRAGRHSLISFPRRARAWPMQRAQTVEGRDQRRAIVDHGPRRRTERRQRAVGDGRDIGDDHERLICSMMRIACRAISMAAIRSRRSSFSSTMSAVSRARSVALPRAIDTSACAMAPASLMPSPTTATGPVARPERRHEVRLSAAAAPPHGRVEGRCPGRPPSPGRRAAVAAHQERAEYSCSAVGDHIGTLRTDRIPARDDADQITVRARRRRG